MGNGDVWRMNIFLDDLRSPWYVNHVKLPFLDWVVVRNYYAFIKAVEENYDDIGELPDFVSFDYDLDCDYALFGL